MKTLKIIAASTLLLASSTYANFEVNRNGVAFSQSSNYIDVVALVEINIKTPIVSFNILSTSYDKQHCTNYATSISKVNGKNVKMYTIKNGLQCMYYPATVQGKEYVRNEFFKKNTVNWQGAIISAKGFTKAVKDLKSQKDAI